MRAVMGSRYFHFWKARAAWPAYYGKRLQLPRFQHTVHSPCRYDRQSMIRFSSQKNLVTIHFSLRLRGQRIVNPRCTV